MPTAKLPVLRKPTTKQARFASEYMIDSNATRAATAAGYSAKSAKDIGCQLLAMPHVKAEVDRLKAEVAARNAIDSDWCIKRLKRVYRMATKAEPVRDRQGNPTGEYKAELSAANRALELIAKIAGVSIDRVDLTTKGKELPPSEAPKQYVVFMGQKLYF